MAEYNVTSPDGTKYRVTGPDGASDADVLAQVRGQHDQRALKSGGTPAGPKPPAPAPQEDSALGFTTGNINKGLAGLAGMPVDTARNALNLGIAGAGRLTGTTPSLIGQDSPGGSQWMEQMLRKAGSIGQSAEPTSAVGRYAASALQMAPGAMFSPGRLGQLPGADQGAGFPQALQGPRLPGVAHRRAVGEVRQERTGRDGEERWRKRRSQSRST